MAKKITDNNLFGLLGRNISYSFSRGYFEEKFKKMGLKGYAYKNFDLNSIDEISEVLTQNFPYLKGLNVTIPYKETVFNFINEVDDKAQAIGAINTIKINSNGSLKGFNTDEFGFRKSLELLLQPHHQKALILGTGGASKAVAYALNTLQIEYKFVSRTKTDVTLSYENITEKVLKEYTLLINCTPLGTFPHTDVCPNLPYRFINEKHLLYDLVYNPAQTLFLQKGLAQGATIKNGLEMLTLQAEEAWRIWNT